MISGSSPPPPPPPYPVTFQTPSHTTSQHQLIKQVFFDLQQVSFDIQQVSFDIQWGFLYQLASTTISITEYSSSNEKNTPPLLPPSSPPPPTQAFYYNVQPPARIQTDTDTHVHTTHRHTRAHNTQTQLSVCLLPTFFALISSSSSYFRTTI